MSVSFDNNSPARLAGGAIDPERPSHRVQHLRVGSEDIESQRQRLGRS